MRIRRPLRTNATTTDKDLSGLRNDRARFERLAMQTLRNIRLQPSRLHDGWRPLLGSCSQREASNWRWHTVHSAFTVSGEGTSGDAEMAVAQEEGDKEIAKTTGKEGAGDKGPEGSGGRENVE